MKPLNWRYLSPSLTSSTPAGKAPFNALIFSLIVMFSAASIAMEADDFTSRHVAPEIGQFLDEQMNMELDKIGHETKASDCHPQELHFQIMNRLGGFGFSKIESMDLKTDINERTGQKIRSGERGRHMGTTIYQDYAGPLSRYGKFNLGTCCASAFSYRGIYLSSDKLGHFIHSGYEAYFYAELQSKPGYIDVSKQTSFWNNIIRLITESNRFSGQNGGSSAVMEMSQNQESGVWGLGGSGVYSYADIVANIEGYKFWKQLTDGPHPFFQCSNGTWQKVRHFTWSEFINPGWDEAMNCNGYADQKMANAVGDRIATVLKKRSLARTSCPIDIEQCKQFAEIYLDEFPEAISPSCKRYLTRESEAENHSLMYFSRQNP